MKRLLPRLSTFVATFFLGAVSAFSVSAAFEFLQQANLANLITVPAIEVGELEAARPATDMPPVFDPNVNYPKVMKTKLLQTGEFHSEEVPYRSGEKWLGLFRIDDRYVLKPTTLEVSPINDDGPMDTKVSTSEPSSAVFLLRGARDLIPGDIETAFDSERGDEFDLIARHNFRRRGQFWWLWVENTTPEGHLQKDSALMLRQSGFDPIVLRSLPEGCDDCGWRVLWVGDLDRDIQLDFLIDVSGHYNSYEPALFLSSKGYSVFASFWGVGC
jgi:hypothetical protein